MPRRISDYFPPCPTRPSNAKAYPDDSYETLKFDIQVVTPMFGGGAEAGVPDPVTLIRPSSIRGHLRFWWRATRGAAFATAKELKQRETEIFGDTEHPSPVIFEVTIKDVGKQQRCGEWSDVGQNDDGSRRFRFEWNAQFVRDQSSLQYVAFPFPGESPIRRAGDAEPMVEKLPAFVANDTRFSLTLCIMKPARLNELRQLENTRLRRDKKAPLPDAISEIATDLRAAVGAWLSFGGLGARSRRGCGALLGRLNGEPFDPLVLARQWGLTIHMGAPFADGAKAWNEVIKTYRDFRQGFRGKPHDKKKGTRVLKNIPGRSHWPEPDSIRKLAGCSLKPRPNDQVPDGVPDDENTHDHSRPIIPSQALPSFPRAVFGMPIIFHFADSPGKNQPAKSFSDPKDAELLPAVTDGAGNVVIEKNQPKTLSRMASPVIARPIYVNGQWRPAFIVLDTRHLKSLVAVVNGRKPLGQNDAPFAVVIPNHQIIDPSLSALKPMAGMDSAISALLNFASSRGFEPMEVTP